MLKALSIMLLSAAVLTCGGCSMLVLHVLDDSTGAPVTGAEVKLTDTASHSTGMGKTDATGTLLLILPLKSGNLIVTKPGYQTLTQDVDALKERALSDYDVDVRLIAEGREPSGAGWEGFPR